MGTSASYSAPPSWGTLKAAVTSHATTGQTAPHKVAELVKSFVAHNGGATGISRGGVRGDGDGGGGGGGGGRGRSGVAKGSNAKATAARLGGFLADVGRVGLTAALEVAGWGDLVGKPVKEVCRALLDRLGGESSTIDDVDARIALSALEKEYFDKAETPEELEQLMQAQVADIEHFLQEYFCLYLYEVFCRVFFERLVQRTNEARAYAVLGQIKDFIEQKLADMSTGRDLSKVDWMRSEGQALVTEVMESTLRVFE